MKTVPLSLHRATRSKTFFVALAIVFLVATAILPALMQPSVASRVTTLTMTTRKEVLRDADGHFDNPFEDLLTLKMTVTDRQGDGYVVTAWTLFGFRLERAVVVPNQSVTTLQELTS